jgi:hypothetical protein
MMKLVTDNRLLRIAMSVALALLFAASLRAEEECLKNAWRAFNRGDYKGAIKFADECIENFGKVADRMQEKLSNDKESLPPTGSVSDADKNKIFKRGPLNDVATAYFIKGRSAENLYRKGGSKDPIYKEMAENAYKAACRYKHGRTWDPNGWFWSPCEAGADRLSSLK